MGRCAESVFPREEEDDKQVKDKTDKIIGNNSKC